MQFDFQVIPIVPQDTEPFAIQATLDGVVFNLVFRFNGRTGNWYFDIVDANAIVLLSRIRIVADTALISVHKAVGLPAGDFAAIDSTGKSEDPGALDLGTRHTFCYLSPVVA